MRPPLDDLREKVEGGTVVCIASGPSLTAEDVELVRQWRGEKRCVFVANTSFRLAPWADALFAMDYKWWAEHREEVFKVFKGKKYTSSPTNVNSGVTRLAPHCFNNFGNSGASCVVMAHECKAETILLLGFDCQHTGGKSHWHGDHPKGLTNAMTVDKWPAKFKNVARFVRKTKVINCSRETALDCFPRASLEECLECQTI